MRLGILAACNWQLNKWNWNLYKLDNYDFTHFTEFKYLPAVCSCAGSYIVKDTIICVFFSYSWPVTRFHGSTGLLRTEHHLQIPTQEADLNRCVDCYLVFVRCGYHAWQLFSHSNMISRPRWLGEQREWAGASSGASPRASGFLSTSALLIHIPWRSNQ